ncbi:hypothetical protein Goarm_012912, partial [Gossypium armourianum]|nr:hypothetical protein [Gossypium armourianum]
MSLDEEYYITLHVGGHFVKDLYVRYVGGEMIRLKEDPNTISYFELCKIVKIGLGFNTIMLIYFHEPGTVRLQNNLRVIYDDTSTIAMLDFWVKFKEIDLYVEHEVDNPIIVDEMFLLTTWEGDVEGVEVDGEGDDEGVESDGESDLERVKSVGESDFRVYFGEDNVSEVTADEYASDFVTSDRVDNVVAACSGVEEDWNETEVWDLNEPRSLVGSDEDEEHENGERMRTTIKDHPKMKLRRIQRICAFEIHDYAHELRSKVPGNTIKMVVQRVIADCLPHFKRYYVCFDALKRGWKAGCRPLIGLDGCFLEGPFKSEFLTIVGRDANNQMFSIAWAVVEGLEIAISDILPRVEHRNCVRHVFAKWSGRKLGKSY